MGDSHDIPEGDCRSRQIGVFTGSVFILAIGILTVPWMVAANEHQLLGVGLLWLGLTVSFEVLFGRFVMHLLWESIFSDFNLPKGGLLPIGLLILALSPLIAVNIRSIFSL